MRKSARILRQVCGKLPQLCGKRPQLCGWAYAPDAFAAFLRARHPAKTASCVAAAIGAPERTVEHWLAGRAAPSALWVLALAGCYGPDALAAMFETPPDWLDAAARAARAAALEAQIRSLSAERAAL